MHAIVVVALSVVLLLVSTALPASGNANAATIYRCKTYSGAFYWSENTCGKSSGVMVDMVQVPDGMPFREQQRIAEQGVRDKQKAQGTEDKERDRLARCAAIDRELAEIADNYKNGRYVAVDKVNAHQQRTRDLRSQRSKLNCQNR